MNEVFEKIIEKLEEKIVITWKHDYDGGRKDAFNEAIEIVKQEAEKFGTDTNVGTNGWIPCSERLPEEGIDVLVWFEYFRYGNYNRLFQTIGISYTYMGKWSGFVNDSSGWRDLKIIAWQPLPKPFQKGE